MSSGAALVKRTTERLSASSLDVLHRVPSVALVAVVRKWS
jgi:hypothetical protein